MMMMKTKKKVMVMMMMIPSVEGKYFVLFVRFIVSRRLSCIVLYFTYVLSLVIIDHVALVI